jgi:hypothetical protein
MRHARVVKPTIWNIRVLIETDNESVVQTKVAAISEILCPAAELGDPQHTCDPAWFIVTRPLSRKKSRRWRSLLNR